MRPPVTQIFHCERRVLNHQQIFSITLLRRTGEVKAAADHPQLFNSVVVLSGWPMSGLSGLSGLFGPRLWLSGRCPSRVRAASELSGRCCQLRLSPS